MRHAVPIALGLGLLAVSWVCWSGRWRGWARIAMLPLMPISALPALGVMLVAIGAGELLGSPLRDVVYTVAFLALAAGMVVWLWDPAWYGPAWYRSREAGFDLSVPINAAIAATGGPVGAASEPAARARFGEPRARWRAHLVSDEHGHPSAMQRVGVVRGHLLLYEEALVFTADAREDRMRGEPVVVAIPAGSIVAVERVPAGRRPDGARRGGDLPSRVMPRLRVETTDGPLYFEAARAGRRAGELAQRYLVARR